MNRTLQIHSLLVVFVFLLVGLLPSPVSAQVTTGTPPFGSFSGGPDVINNANLNAHWTIPVLHKPGRGGFNFGYDLSYDTSVWYPVGVSGSQTWQFVNNWGWSGATQSATGTVSYTQTDVTCQMCNQFTCWYPTGQVLISNWVYTDPWGVPHSFSGTATLNTGGCPQYGGPNATGFTSTAADGSGWTLTITGSSNSATFTAAATAPNGTVENGPFFNTGTGAAAGTDRNGNQITADGSGHFYDTMSSTTAVLTVAGSGTPASPMTLTYTAPSGASAHYTVSYVAYTVATNFGISGSGGITEYGATATNLVDRVTLPDNTFYQFTYEQTPSTPSSGACSPKPGTYQNYCVTARVTSITLPTGGTITYAYSGGNNGILPDGSTATLTRTLSDGAGWNTTWTYAQVKNTGAASTTTITDPTTPTANQTVIQFQGVYETQRDAYQGSTSDTLLTTNYTCYNGSTSPCNSTAITLPINQRAIITKLSVPGSSNVQSKSVALYNSVGGLTEIDAYAFGSGAPPATPTRKTLITYAPLGNITAFRQTVTVQDGSGNALAQTNYNYDETTPTAAPTGTAQLVGVSGSRGNLTSVQRCTVLPACGSFLTTTLTYDTAGQVKTVKDPALNQTSFDYTDNYFTDNGSNPPAPYTPAAPTDAFPKTITPPLNGAVTLGYYFYNGAAAKSTDQNSNNSYTHFDSYGRSSTVQGPGQGTTLPWALTTYATSGLQLDTYLGITDTTPSASCTSCRHDQVALDGLGRATHSYLVSDPEGQTTVDMAYDALGRVLSNSHPHRSSASTTDGIETPTYDALGRTTKVTHPDNTFSQTLYGAAVSGTGVNPAQLCSSSTYGLAFPVLAIDEAGKKREFWTDGLGRTIEADEPDSSGNLTSNTCYSYDPLGNLLQIVHGTQTRTYAYDPLSRVTSVTIPELSNSSGTNCAVTYSYDSNSNIQTRVAPAPNQTTCTSTVTTTYFYDALNRLTKIAYSPATTPPTPTVQYGYDGNTLSGCTTVPSTLTDSNGKGRRTSMCDGSGATSWAHDAAGRIITEMRKIVGTTTVTQTLSYSYNLDGSIATVTYPSTKVITYTVSNAQRLTAAKDVANNVQFATMASYAPTGGLNGMITGQISGGFGGITESHTYNNSLEYTSTKALPPTGPAALDLALSYNLTGGDNGTVTTITNNADTLRTQTLKYDPLNRILSAKSSATSGVDCWGQNFGPDGAAADDAVANLTKINNGTQTPPPCIFGSLNAIVDANNHITADPTYAYDAPGNMTKDGSGSGWLYAFDAENRLTLATGPTGGPYCYVYDGLGLRVAKKSGTANDCSGGTFVKLYWRSIAGNALAESDGSGSVTNTAYTEYVFFAGRRVASRTNSGNGNSLIFYYFADQLGSTRTITTGSGKNSDGSNQTPGLLCYDADFTPYGQEISYTQTGHLQATACPPSYKFTGYERDSETGLDYAFARYYSSRLGRFLSTDPLGGAIGNLQSHNAYAYTRNNPLNSTDPSGMVDCVDGHYGCNCESLAGDCTNDLLGVRWADFWGGDAAIESQMLLRGSGIVSPFDLLELALTAFTIMHRSPDGIITLGPEIIYPFAGLMDFYWDMTYGYGGTQTGSQPKLRPRTQQEYNACIGQAAAARDQRIQNDRAGQAASGALVLIGTAIIYEGGLKGGNPPLLSGETQVELLLHGHGVGWLYANAGLFGPAGAGVALFTYFSIDIAGAEDAYNGAATSCAGAVPAP
jgi:RHS repeat-associated protein